MTFSELKLSALLVSTLNKKGYTSPTPIQSKSIPYILQGRDIFGCAQTGTGKTAAFALPILQMLDEQANLMGIKALILAPTRELASQIGENFGEYGRQLNIKHTVIFGGVPQHQQVRTLRKGVDVLIATPGRLLDLIDQGFVSLKYVKYLVLDEADRMLDMGFIHDIKKIIPLLPSKEQTIFFSATATKEIMQLSKTILYDPVNVEVAPVSSASDLITQSLYYVKRDDKKSLLKHVIETEGIENALIFTRTKYGADKVVRYLKKDGISARAIHGDKTQNERVKALKQFKEKSIRMLVATDVASRGIDVEKLSHVINYDVPDQAESYVHRIGRTGRAGETGVAISFCSADERAYLQDINKIIKTTIDVVENHPYVSDEIITDEVPKKKPHGGKFRGKRRPSKQSSRPKSFKSKKTKTIN